MISTHHTVIVIGAGQAGLAMGALLESNGIEYLIIGEERRVGDTWRNRYDSLRLFTPRWLNRLPLDSAALHPYQDGYPDKEEIARYLEDYADNQRLKLQLQTRVINLQRDGDSFLVTTPTGTLTAAAVVVATGPFQKPRIPAFANQLSSSVLQLHTTQYQNPKQLQHGNVLVVGGGNSGAQIAVELANDHNVHLSVGGPMSIMPQTLLGKSIFWWFDHLGVYRAHINTRLGRRLSRREDPVIGRELKECLQRGDIKLHSRVIDAHRNQLLFSDESALTADNVIWATGFEADYSWMTVSDVLSESGMPDHQRGRTCVPGLFFLGLRWQYSRKSALIGGVGGDALYLLSAIQEFLDRPDSAAGICRD